MLTVQTHEILPGGFEHQITVHEEFTGLARIWRILWGSELSVARRFVGSGTSWFEVKSGCFVRCSSTVEGWLSERHAERNYYDAQERSRNVTPPVYGRSKA